MPISKRFNPTDKREVERFKRELFFAFFPKKTEEGTYNPIFSLFLQRKTLYIGTIPFQYHRRSQTQQIEESDMTKTKEKIQYLCWLLCLCLLGA